MYPPVEEKIVHPYGKAVSAADKAIRDELRKWEIGGQKENDRFLLDHLLNTSLHQIRFSTQLEADKAVKGKISKKYDIAFLDEILASNNNNNKAMREDIPEASLKNIAQTLPRDFREGKADESYTITIDGHKRTMTGNDWTNILIKHLVKIGAEAEKMKLGKFNQGAKTDTGHSR